MTPIERMNTPPMVQFNKLANSIAVNSPNAMTKFTTMLSIAFLVLCLAIGLLDQRKSGQSSIEQQAGDQSGLRTTVESSEDPAAAGAGAGATDATTDGSTDGSTDGATDGLIDGATDGSTDGEG